MRRLSQALSLALLLIAVQAAVLTHEHGASASPAGQSVPSCEFCTGSHAAAPAPDPEVAGHFEARPLRLATAFVPADPAFERRAAHRSRAPPFFRSC